MEQPQNDAFLTSPAAHSFVNGNSAGVEYMPYTGIDDQADKGDRSPTDDERDFRRSRYGDSYSPRRDRFVGAVVVVVEAERSFLKGCGGWRG